MKIKDLAFITAILAFAAVFIFIPPVTDWYLHFNKEHGMVMSFIKFAVLSTLGEVIALRIGTGNYYETGYGILPRMIVWGILGLGINLAFTIFAAGAPAFLAYIGFTDAPQAMNEGFSGFKLFVAFTISATMNLIFAPVMMTFHEITDIHITDTGGTVKGLFTRIPFVAILNKTDWDVMWNFVLKRMIPYFWIPAHTITFLLPVEFRILFAAFLGIALGLILATGSLKSRKS